MKIYKYYKGKVHEGIVNKRAKSYVAEQRLGLAFNCAKRVGHEEASPSPWHAVIEAISEKEADVKRLKDRLHEINSEIGTLKKLEKQYRENNEL